MPQRAGRPPPQRTSVMRPMLLACLLASLPGVLPLFRAAPSPSPPPSPQPPSAPPLAIRGSVSATLLLANLSRTDFQGSDASVLSSQHFVAAVLGALANYCAPCAASSSARVSAIAAGSPVPSVQVAFVLTTDYVVTASTMLQDDTVLTASVFQAAGLACSGATLVGAPSIILDTSPPAPAPAPISRVGIAFGVVDIVGAAAILALCVGFYSASGARGGVNTQLRRGGTPQPGWRDDVDAEELREAEETRSRMLAFEMEGGAGGGTEGARPRAPAREGGEGAWW
jgi:hypothetical protein